MKPIDFYHAMEADIALNRDGFPSRDFNFDAAKYTELWAFLETTHRMLAVELGLKTYETNLISSDFSWIYECTHDAVVRSLRKRIKDWE